MRGYSSLRDSKSLNRIRDIKRELTIEPLDIKQRVSSKYIFGESVEQAEIVCRQYLLLRVAGLNLNRALLYAFGKPGSSVAYFLPPEWRKQIRRHGVKVASLQTALLWKLYVGIMLAYGVLIIAEIIFDGIRATFTKKSQDLGNYVYFTDLVAGNLPQKKGDGHGHNIISWYMQWAGRIVDIDTVCHGLKGAEQREVSGKPVIPVPKPIPPLKGFVSLVRFITWSIGASLTASWSFLRGHWWDAFLLNQAALSTQVCLQEPQKLAKEYLFTNPGWVYRPLWTYEAERRGAEITFYFYSTNSEGFKRRGGDPKFNYGWQAMSWPHYLVWDEYQADFVRRAVGEAANINVVGPIWFSSSAEDFPAFGGRSVAVFDVTPFRESLYRTMGEDFRYYVPQTCLPFLSDIQKITNETGGMMIWKRKRKIASMAHPRYRFFVESLSKSENVIIVDPDISANRVIEACTSVISMPFTSTALIARELGKPSCYYDPTGLIRKDDRGAHGIDIITGPEELKMWLTLTDKTVAFTHNESLP